MCIMCVITHCRSWMRWWSDWPDSVEWKKDWVNPHHLCHRCQTEQALPRVLKTVVSSSVDVRALIFMNNWNSTYISGSVFKKCLRISSALTQCTTQFVSNFTTCNVVKTSMHQPEGCSVSSRDEWEMDIWSCCWVWPGAPEVRVRVGSDPRSLKVIG